LLVKYYAKTTKIKIFILQGLAQYMLQKFFIFYLTLENKKIALYQVNPARNFT